MTEYPVFVPFGDERISAVVTVPDGKINGLVLLVPGLGAPRWHRFQLWARTARRLAERDFASVRMDYVGIGDSLGEREGWTFADLPIGEALAVVRFAERAVGVDRFVVAGNCIGSRIALAVAATEPDCVGAVCIRAPLLDHARGPRARQGARRGKGRLRAVRRVVRRGLGRRIGPGVRDALRAAVVHGRVLFLYGARDYTYTPGLRSQLNGLIRHLPSDLRNRAELRVLSEGPLKGYESRAIQDAVIDALVAWIPSCFG